MRGATLRRRAALWGVAATLTPALVWASEAAEAEGHGPWFGLGLKFLNFAILVGILFYFLRKPVAQGLLDRREGIRKSLEEARQAKEEAEAKYQEYKARVANLEDEIRRLREDFRAEGERQRDRILTEAKQAAEAIRTHAEAAGANEVKRARDQLRSEVADLTVQMAEDLLAKAHRPEDQKAALRKTIENIERRH